MYACVCVITFGRPNLVDIGFKAGNGFAVKFSEEYSCMLSLLFS